MTISFTKACIIGLFVQAILYGLYTASFVYCLRWLLLTDEGCTLRKDFNWLMVVVSMLIFMSQTTDIAISAVMTIAAITTGKAAVFNNLGIVNVRP